MFALFGLGPMELLAGLACLVVVVGAIVAVVLLATGRDKDRPRDE